MTECLVVFIIFSLSRCLILSLFLSFSLFFISFYHSLFHPSITHMHALLHTPLVLQQFKKKKISRNRTEKTDNSATRDSNFLLSNPFVLADCILASFPPSPRVFYNSPILACSLFVKIFAIFCRFSVPYFYPLSAI